MAQTHNHTTTNIREQLLHTNNIAIKNNNNKEGNRNNNKSSTDISNNNNNDNGNITFDGIYLNILKFINNDQI